MRHPERNELQPLFSDERTDRTWLCLAVCLLLAVLLIPVDTYFARELLPLSDSWKILKELPIISEFVGNGYAVILVLAAIAMADLRRRRFALSTYLIVYGAGLAANIIKLMTVRLRPRNVDLGHISGWETFLGPSRVFDVSTHELSFPSGHTTTAFALAYVLTRYYPRGRPVFLLMALCAGIGRVVVQAHYPSDVVGGGIVGWGFAMIVSRYLLVEGAEPRTWLAKLSGSRERVGSAPQQPVATK